MLSVHIENIGELAVIECEGRIVRSEAAFKLHGAVRSQRHVRIIVLDLSEVSAIEGGGLGMLVSLQQWAQNHDIRLKLHQPVRDRLEHANSMRQFDIATLDEMMAILAWADSRDARACMTPPCTSCADGCSDVVVPSTGVLLSWVLLHTLRRASWAARKARPDPPSARIRFPRNSALL